MASKILKVPSPYGRDYRQVGFRSSQLYDPKERPQQPFFSNSDEIEQGREAAAQFERTPWLTPPHREGPASETLHQSEPVVPDQPVAPRFDFGPQNTTQEGYKALEKLMRWKSAGKAEDGLARRFAEALKEYACIGASLQPQLQYALVGEFRRLLVEMVQQRFLEEGHLECLLLAFMATRGWSEEMPPMGSRFPGSASQRRQQEPDTWAMRVRRFIQAAVKDVVQTMHPEMREKWKQFRIAEVRDSSSDVYSSVDVRAWPLICEILSLSPDLLASEAVCRQIQLQMCVQGTTRPMKYQWLCQAADLLHKLHLQVEFDEVAACEEQGMIQPGIYTTFNDRMLAVNERKEVLYTVLKDAPQNLIRKVLSRLDEDLDETERKEDYELRMLYDLLDELDQDIRRCSKAFYRLKRSWISSYDFRTGVIENEELTPAQFCDHIEDDPNYEVLLRDAVNRLMRLNRTFEAAKMLARPKAKGTKVVENIKDNQVLYIRSLYEEEQEPEDSFAPLAVGSMCLPGGEEDVLRVPSTEHVNGEDRVTRDALDILKQELLEGPPVAVGVWWLWRCFNAHIDQHSRAAVLALTYRHRNGRNRLVLVDMIALEQANQEEEHLHKDVLGQILNAPHILKVVHFLERTALRALQLAFVTEDVRQGPTKPESYISISPCVDMALVVACLQGTSGVQCNELFSLVWNFMRADMCLTEGLSNFERRPLRKTQEHYALSLAFCPLALLRALCSFGQAQWVTVLTLCMKIHGGAVGNWDEDLLKNLCFKASEDDSRFPEGEGAAFAGDGEFDFPGNIWEAEIVDIRSGADMKQLSVFVMPRREELRVVYTRQNRELTNGTKEADKALEAVKAGLQPEEYPLKAEDHEGNVETIYHDKAEARLEALRPPPRKENCIIYTADHTFLTYDEVVGRYEVGNPLQPHEFPIKVFYLKNHKEVKQLFPDKGKVQQEGTLRMAWDYITRASLGLSVPEQAEAKQAVLLLKS